MSKKEMSRKLNSIGAMSVITMMLCDIILLVCTFMYVIRDVNCITGIVTATSLWVAGFVTYQFVVSSNDDDE